MGEILIRVGFPKGSKITDFLDTNKSTEVITQHLGLCSSPGYFNEAQVLGTGHLGADTPEAFSAHLDFYLYIRYGANEPCTRQRHF